MFPTRHEPCRASRGLVLYRALLALTVLIATQAGAATPAPAQHEAPHQAAIFLKKARTWGYQLQNIDARKLDLTAYDVLVVDAGSGDGAWGISRKDIARLKTKPDGTRRIVLAYMNIGEAEDYRYYWNKSWETSPPPWMGSANCRWKGDHRVRHWMPAWQDIIFGSPGSYLGRLMKAGYDGVYLDRVDIFYHWRTSRWQSAAEMVNFVTRLSHWAKSRQPGFLVVPQNAEELLSVPRYMSAIDAIGKEDMLYGDRGNDVANSAERIARAQRNFAPALASGLPVFAIEYARAQEHQHEIRTRHAGYGFKLYFGPRSLTYLGQDGPPHPEDADTESVASADRSESCE